MLNLFYEEPEPDRWLPYDRYPRHVVRRLLRGPSRPGGVMRWYLNLRAGLDLLGVPYRVNDYRALRRSPGAWAHVIGKPHVIGKIAAGHPIVYGPGVASHPCESDFWGHADIRLVLLSCAWFRAMYDRDLPVPIPTDTWPAGIDTARWRPGDGDAARSGILVYDKIRWRRDELEQALLAPILRTAAETGEPVSVVRYGCYEEEDYRALLPTVRAMFFLCEHETQGFAYLQALASDVPILAWDRGGYWQDPSLYPERVRFEPVSSVPYFDDRCGLRFGDLAQFRERFPAFWQGVGRGAYRPRDYVLESLTLEQCARRYLEIAERAAAGGAR